MDIYRPGFESSIIGCWQGGVRGKKGVAGRRSEGGGEDVAWVRRG